jgi:hypothetical protein
VFPRLGVLHFTLAMVLVPFGAPQARTVTATPQSAAKAIVDDGAPATPAAVLARFASFGRGSAPVDPRAR